MLMLLHFEQQSYNLYNSVLLTVESAIVWNESGSYPRPIDYSQATSLSRLNVASVEPMTNRERR